jgi:hypothetical protein
MAFAIRQDLKLHALLRREVVSAWLKTVEGFLGLRRELRPIRPALRRVGNVDTDETDGSVFGDRTPATRTKATIWSRCHCYQVRHHQLRAETTTREMLAFKVESGAANQAGRGAFVVERGEHFWISLSRGRSLRAEGAEKRLVFGSSQPTKLHEVSVPNPLTVLTHALSYHEVCINEYRAMQRLVHLPNGGNKAEGYILTCQAALPYRAIPLPFGTLTSSCAMS